MASATTLAASPGFEAFPTDCAIRSAGLQAEDVILSFDGKPVPDPNQLRWLASLAGVGKTVTVRVQRLDKLFDVRVTLGPLPPMPDE